MTQVNVANRDWQQTRDRNSADMEQESITSADHQSRSPVSLASETEPSMLQQDNNNNHGTPIHHPRFTNHREKLGNDSTNGMIVRPIPVHATLQQHRPAGPDTTNTSSEQQRQTTSSNNIIKENRSRPKRELSSDQLNLLPSSSSYKTTAPATTTSNTVGASPAKRIRFMSFDEILTTAKQSGDDDGTLRPPPFVLESVEELDLQLGEELKSTALDIEKMEGGISSPSSENPTSSSRTALSLTATYSPRVSPVCVPLLTPPQSPARLQQSIEIVEWPSNLVVESALMSVMAMTTDDASNSRPLSPASLVVTGGGENYKEVVHNNDMETTTTTTGDVTTIGDKGCTLTKRLSFITVGSN